MFKWLGSSRKPKPERPAPSKARKRAAVVQVLYFPLTEPLPDIKSGQNERGYGYFWRLPEDPQLGQRVVVPVEGEGLKSAVIIGFGRQGYDGPLKTVSRTLSRREARKTPEG